jgi:hypothetical protein
VAQAIADGGDIPAAIAAEASEAQDQAPEAVDPERL